MPDRVRRKSVVDMLAKVPVHRGSLLRSLDDLLKTIEISESAVMIPTLLRDKCQFDAWELLFVAKILKASILGHSDLVEFYMNHMGNQAALQQHQQQINQVNSSHEQQLLRAKTGSNLNLTNRSDSLNNSSNLSTSGGNETAPNVQQQQQQRLESPSSMMNPWNGNLNNNNNNNSSSSNQQNQNVAKQDSTSAMTPQSTDSNPTPNHSASSSTTTNQSSGSLSWFSAATNGARESISDTARPSNPSFVDCFPEQPDGLLATPTGSSLTSHKLQAAPKRLDLPDQSCQPEEQSSSTIKSNKESNSTQLKSTTSDFLDSQADSIEQLASRLESSQIYNSNNNNNNSINNTNSQTSGHGTQE